MSLHNQSDEKEPSRIFTIVGKDASGRGILIKNDVTKTQYAYRGSQPLGAPYTKNVRLIDHNGNPIAIEDLHLFTYTRTQSSCHSK